MNKMETEFPQSGIFPRSGMHRGATFLTCFRKRGLPQERGGSNPGGNYDGTRTSNKKCFEE